MANKTPQQITEKYTRKMQGAGVDYEAGVKSPSRPWEQATINGAARWQVGVQEAIAKGSFASGVQGKGAKWAERASTLGVQRYQQSAQSAGAAYAQVAGKIIDITRQVSDSVRAMDNSTPAAREQRALENMRRIKQAWGK